MTTEKINTQQLFASLDKTWAEFMALVSSVDFNSINKIPIEDSWTVAQVATHVTKSNKAIIQGLQMKGKPCERNADEHEKDLKKTFLDFSVKYQSPDFIVPENKNYKKDEVIDKLKNSIEQLKQLSSETNLPEIIELPIFGEITKLEILYFVLYHTQRHIQQLKNILQFINNKN